MSETHRWLGRLMSHCCNARAAAGVGWARAGTGKHAKRWQELLPCLPTPASACADTEAGELAVYIATGTMVTPQAHQVEALAAAAETLASQHHVRVIWSLKTASQQLLPAGMRGSGGGSVACGAGRRILIEPFVNQQAVLASSQVRVFVSHVGLGSTHEGLAAGKPILATPFFGDQPTNAAQVVARGLGLRLNPRKLRAHQVTAAVLRLLHEPEFAAAAKQAASQLSNEPGATTAARLVMQFCAAGNV